MHAPDASRTIAFVNLGHALDHYLLLIFPTAVIAIALEWQMTYGELVGLATGAFVAFGLFALPVGWLADRIGRRAMMAAFYFGSGVCCFGLSQVESETALALWLFGLGAFTAIYHPVGSALLVANARKLGRDLGINGVWGNVGAASAPIATAFLVGTSGWQMAFLVPGVVAVLVGIAFLAMVPKTEGTGARGKSASQAVPTAVTRPVLLAVLYLVGVFAGGFTFNMSSIAMPKVIDERLGMDLPLMLTGSLTTAVFAFGALTQLSVGRMIDRVPLPRLFVAVSLLQPLGLGIAAFATGIPMLVGLIAAMAAIYGQVVINDAMIARYVPEHLRSRAFGLRYFFGFTTSGFAVPMIAYFHAIDGFTLVLGIAALFGLAIFSSALGFLTLTRYGPAASQAAAE